MRRFTRSWWLLVLWQLIPQARELPVLIVLHCLVTVGVVIGLGFLVHDVHGPALVFLATAAPVFMIVTVGLVEVPQQVASAKLRGTFDYLWTMPLPRLAHLVANLTVALVVMMPGITVALLAASARFDITFAFGPLTLVAIALAALTATSMGYAIAYLSPSPHLTHTLTQLILFAVFLFSPVAFPADRLPAPVAAVHTVLPVQYMADAIRGSLSGASLAQVLPAILVLCAWCTAGLTTTYAIIRRPR